MNRVFRKGLSWLLVVAMVMTMFAGMTFTASAAEATDIVFNEGVCTISAAGTYKIPEDGTGNINVTTNDAVTIVGNLKATEDGGYEGYNSNIFIDCSKATNGANITIRNCYIKDNNSTIMMDFNNNSDNKLYISGTNVIDYDIGFSQNNNSAIHVPKGSSISIDNAAGETGTLYLYKNAQGAGIGGSTGEMNGDITFGNEVSETGPVIFGKGSRQGAFIGAGANASSSTEAPGKVVFNGGVYNLMSISRGACIGGSAGSGGGSTGTTVCINGGTININADYSGSAVGGGGYAQGNDASGGTMYVSGGSLRTYVDKNAASNVTGWGGKPLTEGVNDAVITAKRLNNETDQRNVYMLTFNTENLKTAANTFDVKVDGADFYKGGLHEYHYVNEALEKNSQKPITDTWTNWEPMTEKNLYFYVTGENHQINVNGELFDVEWDSTNEVFTTAGHQHKYILGKCSCGVTGTAYKWYVNETGDTYTISTADEFAAFSELVNQGVTFAGKTIELKNNITLTEKWTPIGGASTKHELNLGSKEDFDNALAEHFLIYDNTGASYVKGSDKNGTYDENRTYYYLEGAAFAGIFDGKDNTISGLDVVTDKGYAGLFGNISGTVKDFRLKGAVKSTTTQDFVGGVTGKLSAGGNISGILAYVDIDAPNAFNVGGIAGFIGEMGAFVSEKNPMATISQCANYGEVKGKVRVGGIAGRSAGTVVQCANHGTVFNYSGQKKGTGGIVGMNGVNNTATDAGIIKDCYNDGYVNGNKGFWTGGIAGFMNAKSEVVNCYNAGTLYAAASATGSFYSWVNPIVGQSEGTVKDCYWLNKDTGDNTANYIGKDSTGNGNAGGTAENIVGKTEKEMKEEAFVALLNGEEKTWVAQKNAFPELRVFTEYAAYDDQIEALEKQLADLKAEYDKKSGEQSEQLKALEDKIKELEKQLENLKKSQGSGGTVISGGSTDSALASEKEKAMKELQALLDKSDDYYADEKAELASAVLAGVRQIESAKDKAAAQKALTEAKAKISTIKTKAQVDAEKAELEKTKLETAKKEISQLKVKATSSKTSKGNIKVKAKVDVKAITDLGYTVKYKYYRSVKKASGYKALKTKSGKTYTNTTGKKGTKYYYKVKALVYDGDKLIGSTKLKQSTAASRKK